jgi:hypothetical protein
LAGNRCENRRKQAREAVYCRNAADALSDVRRIAEQLSISVLNERGIEASLQFRELIFRIPKEREEFASFLGADAVRLNEIESNCKLWADFLGTGKFPRSVAEKKQLIHQTIETVQELSAIQGRLRRIIEQGEK